MKRVLSILPLLLCLCCTREGVETAGSDSSSYLQGEIIVEFADEMTSSDELDRVLADIGATSFERLYPDAGEWEPRHREAGLHRWYRIVYDASAVPATKARGDLSHLPGIVYVEPVRRISRADSYFNDTYAKEQWSLYNDGSMGADYAKGCDINVREVWKSYTAGTEDVIVAVIDEGVQLNHADLIASTVPAGSNGSRCFIYGYEGYQITPGNHGTHVAGIIGATSNNGIGISGVAGGNDGKGGVRLMNCEVLRVDPDDEEKTLQGSMGAAIVWAADHGAVIANNSWQYIYESEEEALAGGVGSLGNAIDYFIRYAGCDVYGNQRPDSPMKGGLVIFAAGNNGYSIGWPAAYEPVLAVGAISSKFTRAGYSNYGDWVDICAPGGDYDQGSVIISTLTSDGYGYAQGTSMACPHVSGVAALLLSYYGGQGFTCDMLRQKILDGATKEKAPGGIGPIVNALGSFTCGGSVPPDPVTDYDVSVKSNLITFRWGVTRDVDDVKAFSFYLLASRDMDELLTLDLSGGIPATVSCTRVDTGANPVGEGMSGVVAVPEFNADYYVALVASDSNRNYSAISPVKHVVTGSNHPPVLSPLDGTRFTLKSHETLTCRFSCSDPDGQRLLLICDPGSYAFTATIGDGLVNAVIRGADAPSGKYQATVTVSDGFGESASCSLEYEILPNHAPVIVRQIDNQVIRAPGSSIKLRIGDYFHDEDGEEPECIVTIGGGTVLSYELSDGVLSLTALDYGISDVSVTVRDVRGETASMAFKVLIDDGKRTVKLYPNPVRTVLNIWTATEDTYAVSVTGKSGAVVRSASFRIGPFNPVSIDLSDLPSGIYSVRLKGGGMDGGYSVAKL